MANNPVAEFLKALASDPALARKFAGDRASVVDADATLDTHQKTVLKSGCVKDVLGLLVDPNSGSGDKQASYFVDPNGVSCGHPDCQAFQKHAHGKQ